MIEAVSEYLTNLEGIVKNSSRKLNMEDIYTSSSFRTIYVVSIMPRCQDFLDKIRTEYNRLKSEEDIQTIKTVVWLSITATLSDIRIKCGEAFAEIGELEITKFLRDLYNHLIIRRFRKKCTLTA